MSRSEWHKARQSQLDAMPYCAVCSGTYGLVVHHIRNRGMGFRDNSPDNLVTLCFEHHTGADGVHTLGRRTFRARFGDVFSEGES